MAPAPSLRHCFTVTAHVDPGIPLEKQGQDVLEFIPLTGGSVTGDITGEIVPGGGDWCLVRADGTFAVEARYLIRTTDGDIIDVYNVGVVRKPEGGDVYFETTPRFRTVAPHLQWLTRSMFVGRARANEHDTTIEIFEITT